MNGRIRLATIIAVVAVTSATAVPSASGEDWFGVRIGAAGFNLSVGTGAWGLYAGSWGNPSWTISFDTTLAGYGEWVWVDGLGRVWRPWTSTGWRPYTHGRWVYTRLGWTWVSYEPWGYLPHHYGNWAFASCGWVWVPGYTYHPARVNWVHAGSWVGWYPTPPHGWSHSRRGFMDGYRQGSRDGYSRGFDHGYGAGYTDGWRDAQYATYVGWRDLGTDNIARRAADYSAVRRYGIEGYREAPTIHDARARGAQRLTETTLEVRTVNVGGRTAEIARPAGVSRSVERHASETVTSALAERARRQPATDSRRSTTASSEGREISRSATGAAESSRGLRSSSFENAQRVTERTDRRRASDSNVASEQSTRSESVDRRRENATPRTATATSRSSQGRVDDREKAEKESSKTRQSPPRAKRR